MTIFYFNVWSNTLSEIAGVVFPKGEPGGGIVGSAGLVLGLATEVFGISSACILEHLHTVS